MTSIPTITALPSNVTSEGLPVAEAIPLEQYLRPSAPLVPTTPVRRSTNHTTMTSIFVEGMSSRFSLEGAITVSDVLHSAPSLGDNDLIPLDYFFKKRDTNSRIFSNPDKLKNIMDILQLNLYLIEFRGNGDRARGDNGFLDQRLKDIMKRMDSRYERSILVAFNVIQENSERGYGDKIRLLRKQVNDWWKDAYKITDNVKIDQGKLRGICDEYRWYRIQYLKEIYGEEWENFIWRILDIDDIGEFFNEIIPAYKNAEEEKKKTYHSRKSYGNFGNIPFYSP